MTNNTLSPKPKYTHKAPNLKTVYFNVVDCFARKEAETVYSLVYPSTRYLSPPALQKVQWLARNYLCLQDTGKRGSKQCQFMWEVSPKTTRAHIERDIYTNPEGAGRFSWDSLDGKGESLHAGSLVPF